MKQNTTYKTTARDRRRFRRFLLLIAIGIALFLFSNSLSKMVGGNIVNAALVIIAICAGLAYWAYRKRSSIMKLLFKSGEKIKENLEIPVHNGMDEAEAGEDEDEDEDDEDYPKPMPILSTAVDERWAPQVENIAVPVGYIALRDISGVSRVIPAPPEGMRYTKELQLVKIPKTQAQILDEICTNQAEIIKRLNKVESATAKTAAPRKPKAADPAPAAKAATPRKPRAAKTDVAE